MEEQEELTESDINCDDYWHIRMHSHKTLSLCQHHAHYFMWVLLYKLVLNASLYGTEDFIVMS